MPSPGRLHRRTKNGIFIAKTRDMKEVKLPVGFEPGSFVPGTFGFALNPRKSRRAVHGYSVDVVDVVLRSLQEIVCSSRILVSRSSFELPILLEMGFCLRDEDQTVTAHQPAWRVWRLRHDGCAFTPSPTCSGVNVLIFARFRI
jgi:hypothetical protein